MARRKNSTALFEVITKPQSYPRARERSRPRESFFGGAAAWVKRHLEASATARAAAPVPAKPPRPRVAAEVAAESMLTAPPEQAAYDDAENYRSRRYDAGSTDESTEEGGDDSSTRTVALDVDPERRNISVHMSYTAAVVGGTALAVVIGLAIIAAQRVTRGSAPLLAQTTTDKLLQGPTYPEVLDPRRSFASSPAGGAATRTRTAVNSSKAPPESRPAPEPTPGGGDGKRYVGLNYVIIQSYHPAEEKMAREAAAFLNKEGIVCTVETGVKGYQAITVVGVTGFDKISSPAFRAYTQRIQQASTKLTGNNRGYKAFTPVAKKWDKKD